MRAAAAALARGQGGVIALVGDPGIGKSRLLLELVASKELEAARVLPARSISIGQNLSFHPFIDLLRSWAEIGDATPEAEALAKLATATSLALEDRGDETLPFLATLMGLRPTGTAGERLRGIEGEALEKLILRSMRELLEALATAQPLVLLFEDLHWADLSSVSLLDALVRIVLEQPVLVVTAFRPGFAETSDRFLESAERRLAGRVERIELQPLGPQQSRRLLDGLFRGGHLPTTIKAVIEGKGGGNPFFLEEVVRSLIDEGAVEYRDGALFSTEKIHQVQVPGTIREVLLFRVDRLERARKELLQIASVIGREFEQELLEKLAPDPSRVEDELASLGELQLIEYDGRWSFKHALTQDVVYESILRARRRELHRSLAQLIEREAADPSPLAARLAYHFGLGGDTERAEHYLFVAGDEAARSAASDEALRFFQQAAELYFQSHGEGGDPDKRARLQSNIARAFFNRGRLIEAADAFGNALEALGERVPRGNLDLVAMGARAFLDFLAQLYLPAALARRRPTSERQREVIRLLFSRAKAQTTASPARFLVDSLDALRRLRGIDPGSVELAGAMFAGAVGIFSYGGLSFRISERVLVRAAAMLNRGDPRELFLYRLWHFLHHLLAGSWERMEPTDPELLDENLRLGQLWEIVTYLGLETEWLVYRGRFDDAAARLERLAKLEDLYAYDLAKSNHQGISAFLHLERRDLDRAFAAIEEYYTAHRENLMNIVGLSTMAKIDALRGRSDAAARWIATASDVVRASGRVPAFHLVQYWQARLRCELGDLEAGVARSDARARRRRARPVLRTARRATQVARGAAWHRPEIHRLRGTVHWVAGDARAALRWWERSAREAERLGMRPELGRTLLEVARRTRDEPTAPPEFLGRRLASCEERAAAIFDELDLRWDRAQLDRVRLGAVFPAPSSAG
jgi:hypothetical protein